MNPELDTIRDAALRVATRLVGATAAEDIAQETVLRAMPRLDEIARYAYSLGQRIDATASDAKAADLVAEPPIRPPLLAGEQPPRLVTSALAGVAVTPLGGR